MRLEHQHARQAAHPVDVGEAAFGLRLRGHVASDGCVENREAPATVRGRYFGKHERLGRVRYNLRLPATRQLGPFAMLGVWAVLCFTGVLYATWHGYGDRQFAATLTTFAFYFAVMLLFAAQGVPEFLGARFGAGSGYLLGMAVILAYLIYAIGTNTFAFARVAAIVGGVFIPLGLAASAEREGPGHGKTMWRSRACGWR